MPTVTSDDITAPKLTRLLIIHIFSKHGVPTHITCNCGSKFISHFFHSLGPALDMKIHFTSGYHLEGDSQTKCLNQTLEQYLHIFCNYQQDNWLEILLITVYPKHELASTKTHKYVVDLDELHTELCSKMDKAQACYQGPANCC